ncbi:MAG TPA: TetR/AcrR family transcriptional regulator [Acidimicrobiales bacterium]|nr:TetR/AcrR family transcriptional regulator [Acidimicrobiales bacterium]
MVPTAKTGPTGTGPVPPVPTDGQTGTGPAAMDGRQRRRERNREAVVDALLDLYRVGNLRPSSEEIAARSGLSPRSLFRYFDDVDDLIRAAIRSQEARALPLLPVAAAPEDPFDVKVAALVDQRLRLFGAVGHAATVSRLRSPFQPLLAAELAQNRKFLRNQVRRLFAPELGGMDEARSTSAVAAADVLTSFESYQLLVQHRAMPEVQVKRILADALTVLLGPA